MSLPLCSQPPFLGIPLSLRRDSRLAPQHLETHPYTNCGSSHLSGYGLQGTGLPRTPRSTILLQLCEAQFLGTPLCLEPPLLPKHRVPAL